MSGLTGLLVLILCILVLSCRLCSGISESNEFRKNLAEGVVASLDGQFDKPVPAEELAEYGRSFAKSYELYIKWFSTQLDSKECQDTVMWEWKRFQVFFKKEHSDDEIYSLRVIIPEMCKLENKCVQEAANIAKKLTVTSKTVKESLNDALKEYLKVDLDIEAIFSQAGEAYEEICIHLNEKLKEEAKEAEEISKDEEEVKEHLEL